MIQDPLVIKNLRSWLVTYSDQEKLVELGDNAEERYSTWLEMLAAYDDATEELEDVKARLASVEADAKERERKLRTALSFFASVIKSGEPWSDTCQWFIDQAFTVAPAEQEVTP